LSLLAAFVALSGCGFGPKESPPSSIYDFGLQKPLATQARIHVSLQVQDIMAPTWLNNHSIYYRLAYQDAAKPQAYANSRWIASPAALLGLRLRQSIAAATEGGMSTSLDGAKADYTLRLELEEFCQVFDSSNTSHVVVRLRATLVGQALRNLAAQKIFMMERSSPSPNADGAAKSLAAASDELIVSLINWMAEQKLAEKSS
jgi:cholesterol transport system auxiliary component